MKYIRSIILAVGLSLVAACGSDKDERRSAASPSALDKEEVTNVYNLYLKGDYNGYVDKMLSCDDKPEDYRRQMALTLKQHAAARRAAGRVPQRAEVVRVEQEDGAKHAEAFIALTYTDSCREEVVQRFVWHKGCWRLR